MQARDNSHARGIDVSHYQGTIDWAKVRASGISFAFIKATEGTTYTDSKLAANLAGAKAAGIKVGAYHFCRAGIPGDAEKEANYFIQVLNSLGGIAKWDLPPALDIETTNNATNLTRTCQAWLSRVQATWNVQPLLYTYPYFAKSYLDASLGNVPLWYANYGVNQPADVAGWTRWQFLQYSDSGTVPGIVGPVDMNEFDGSEDELMGYELSVDDANKIIAFLSAAYNATSIPAAQDEFHRLANELRKASGQPEQ
ncbi:glycoside hydrolase family 25 protein [Paenibacillus sp. N1-5-1-14]|uniref:glycoside hydrolase family 25 protein n=1 Tax=Paenibacillus radicibacter TaxID=2972488 RepID=UPI002158BC64|nr:glycoside hydrolase family 25 protein [Paenibacillus radicibacter]MCR8645236.1 glycoside hydrolase family 25 protein [Paenibacillus radicibacter]